MSNAATPQTPYHLVQRGSGTSIDDLRSQHRASIASSRGSRGSVFGDLDLRVEPVESAIEDVAGETFLDILCNPRSMVVLCLLGIGSAWGCLAIALVFVGYYDLNYITALALFVVGALAAYEEKCRGGIQAQISQLSDLTDELKEDTSKIGGEVGFLKAERGELEVNVNNMSKPRLALTESANELEQRKQALVERHKKFEEENAELKQTEADLSAMSEKLKQDAERLTSTVDSLSESMAGFAQMKEQIQKMAAGSNESIIEAMQKLNSSYERMDNLMYENEKIILMDKAHMAEFRDKSEGMQKKEFIRFSRSIPKKYRDYMKANNMTWDSLRGDDEMIDPQEMESIIQKLLVVNKNREV